MSEKYEKSRRQYELIMAINIFDLHEHLKSGFLVVANRPIGQMSKQIIKIEGYSKSLEFGHDFQYFTFFMR